MNANEDLREENIIQTNGRITINVNVSIKIFVYVEENRVCLESC